LTSFGPHVDRRTSKDIRRRDHLWGVSAFGRSRGWSTRMTPAAHEHPFRSTVIPSSSRPLKGRTRRRAVSPPVSGSNSMIAFRCWTRLIPRLAPRATPDILQFTIRTDSCTESADPEESHRLFHSRVTFLRPPNDFAGAGHRRRPHSSLAAGRIPGSPICVARMAACCYITSRRI